jgi:hypothetical protein
MIDELFELLFIQKGTPLSVMALCPLAFEIRILVLFVALGFVPEFSDMWGSEAAYSFVSGNIDGIDYAEQHGSVLCKRGCWTL